MFESLKIILQYINLYYSKNHIEIVINLYKCLVNASFLKDNSEFLIKSDLNKTILNCFYSKN